ncbi:hypothetical protein ACOMHN_034790 [Nucella lapillus]
MIFELRSGMLSPLIFSLLIIYQPITCFQVNFDPQPELSWPFSLDDCQELAANQPARWKETFKFCMTLFFNKPSDLPDSSDQSNPLRGVPMTTDAQFRGIEDIRAGVIPLMALKRFDQDFASADGDDDDVDDTFFIKKPINDNDDDDDDDDGDDFGVKGLWQKSYRRKKWPSVISRAVLRTRRQHSLSINSALWGAVHHLRGHQLYCMRRRKNKSKSVMLEPESKALMVDVQPYLVDPVEMTRGADGLVGRWHDL